MRAHSETRDFLHLEVDVGIDHVVREHAATSEELTILVEMLERHIERVTHRWDVLSLFWFEIVQVLVGRIARVDLVLNTVEARHHHGGESEVRVGGRVREAHFDTTRLRIGNERNSDRCGTVTRRIREHDRRFEARHETLVAVGARIGEGVQCLSVLDDAADIVKRELGEAAVLVTCKQGFAVLLQGLVHVHTEPLSPTSGLGMKVAVLP